MNTIPLSSTISIPSTRVCQPPSPYVLQSSLAPRFYCPTDLDLSALIVNAGYDVWLPHLWKLYYVLTVIYRARWNKSVEQGQFVPLSSTVLASVLGTRSYRDALQLLQSFGVIESDNHYIVGRASKGFRFTLRYQHSKFREVKELDVSRVPSRLFKIPAPNEQSPIEHRFLFDNLKRVTVAPTVESFFRHFRPQSVYQEDFYRRSVEFIRDAQWFFSHDKKTGRVFNNVTNLPKELRPFLRVEARPLVEIDVVNCQPLLLLALYSAERERHEFERAVVGGTFYEELDAALPEPFGPHRRNELKQAVFVQVLFDRVRQTPSKMSKAFSSRFPVLYRRIEEVKRGDHRKLALMLQSLEAQIVVGDVVKSIATGARFPVLTIHDSILTFPELAGDVSNRLGKAFASRLGTRPKLKVKEFAPPAPSKAVSDFVLSPTLSSG